MAFIEEEDRLRQPRQNRRWNVEGIAVTLLWPSPAPVPKVLINHCVISPRPSRKWEIMQKKKNNTKAGSYLEGSAAQLLPQWWWLQDNWWNATNTDVFQTNMVAKGPGIWSSCWDLSKVKVGIFKLHADVTLANFLASLLIWECTAPGSSGPLFFLNSY